MNTESIRSRRRVLLAFSILAILLGAVQAWTSRFDMAPDGIQYLDNGEAYFRHEWKDAANSYWSPLYPWLLGAALKLFKPSSYWEFPTLHFVNFGIYLCLIVSFRFFLRTFFQRRELAGSLPAAAAAVACSAFLYATMDLTNIENPSPDLVMAVFVFLAAGLIVRISDGDRRPITLFAFGLTLGLGYLAKVPFFIFSAISFSALAVMMLRRRLRPTAFLAAAAAFSMIAVPYIAFLSREKGRITCGDSGRYNLIWAVNGITRYHWQGGAGSNGAPLHPTRQLSDSPQVYEFATPVYGTYPPWYDPTYWNEGASVQYRPADFLRAAITNARIYFYLFHHRQTPLICGFLILFLLIPKREFLKKLSSIGALVAFSIFPFAMYLMVVVDVRYIGAFVTLLWTVLFAAAVWSARDLSPRIVSVICGATAAMMVIEALLVAVPTPPLNGGQDRDAPPPFRNAQQQIALCLEKSGIRPGDSAAIIGYDLPYDWARLARVRIVAQIFPSGGLYDAQSEISRAAEWGRARDILSKTAARFVISPAIPGIVDQPGWERVGATQAFIYRLRSS